MSHQVGDIWKEDGVWYLQCSKHLADFSTKKAAENFWNGSLKARAPWTKNKQ